MRLLLSLLAALLGTGIQAAEPNPTDPAAVEFFEKEVRPLLIERCQSCHGAKKQKGDLRLDSRVALLAGGKTGPAVVPGDPAESLLIDAVNYGDLYQMPPKSKLADKEIAILTRWVKLGAPWSAHDASQPATAAVAAFDLKARAKHWSFQPVRAVEPPAVALKDWPRTPIDRFLLATLEANGLRPAPEADRRTLIRRLTFDLTGLPPTAAEIDAFLADDSTHAYESVVERLLASPHHGERWARHWLDLVRFAETAGHEFDYDAPDAYRYRDYVVRALNADLPYNQFVVEHVAGDLLASPRRNPADGSNESILATGFYFLGEGTHSPVDLRDDEAAHVDNQIDVLSKTFLGLTVACARCHDHKFDAISTADYYALSGYLKSSRHQHAFIDPPGRVAAKADALRALKDRIKAQLDLPAPSATTTSDPNAGVVFEDFEAPGFAGWSVTGDAFGAGPTRPGDFVVHAGANPARVELVAPGQAHSGLVSDRLQGVLRSRTFVIEKPLIHYLAAGRHGRVNLVIDGFEKIKDPIYGRLTFEVSADAPRWYSQDVSMWLGHRASIELADGATVNYTGGRTEYFRGDGFLAVDEIRFGDHGPPRLDTGRDLPRALPMPAEAVARYREIEASIPPPSLALAIADGTGEDDRVHIRGGTRTLGAVVPRRFLEAIAGPNQPAPGAGSGREQLARDLVDPANPLVARVFVNRVWKHHFGDGIVRSTDDFGVMGQRPTHPELLDWLAARFVADGWSLKALHRLIVLSSAYRMQSRLDPEADRVDPSNRLLHRMNVRRLDAESIRDALLALSGRLDPTIGGPSVPPHLTEFMDGRGRPGRSGPLDGDGRRSLYLNVRRNFLTPMLLAFDFPVPFSTMGRRNVSNVPAQALTLLNDPFVVSQARRWSERARAEGDPSPAAIVTRMYVAAFGRPPAASELAESLAFVGDPAQADPRAWADLAHVLINVKEFLYVD